MILQALYRLSEQEELLPDPDYEVKPVAWLVRVDEGGKPLGIEGTRYTPTETEGRRKPKPVAKSFLIPRQRPSRQGIKPPEEFFVDNALYVFGIDLQSKHSQEVIRERSQWFRDRVLECVEATGDEGARAVLTFLEDLAAGRQAVDLPEDCKSNDLFAFIYAPDVDRLVTSREKVRQYWKSLRAEEYQGDATGATCLVTGKPCLPVGKHPSLKGVPGGTSSGVALVSYNSSAFESYGWKGNSNSTVSRVAAEACSTALNRLLAPDPRDPRDPNRTLPRRNIRLSADTVICYWAGGESEFVSAFDGLLEANPETVKRMYHSVWRGLAPSVEDPSAFYALTLSGAQGRAIVRDWFETTVATAARNLARHFADLDIVRNTPKPKNRDLPPTLPLRALLGSLAPLGKSKAIPAPMIATLLRAALHNTPYPLSLLQRAIQRMRAEIGRTDWPDLERRDARAALIKALLNRRKRFHPQTTEHYKEVTPDMDPTNTNPGYLLGRLMAVIERMQQLALGDVNATVVDRFFSGASAAPRSAFPRLLKNLRHHASKAKDDERTGGTARWLESQVDGILAPLAGFPASLNLEEQGLFVLGYHHQRHNLWMSKEEKQKKETAHVEN